MFVIEYRDKFVELSRYAPEEVVDEEKKQELFVEGLAGPLQYQLIPHTFPSFQTLLDKSIGLEYKRKELEELKRKATTPGQSGSNTRPRFNSPRETPFQSEGLMRLWATAISVSSAADFTTPLSAESSDRASCHSSED
jgi:hypothetical protein